MRGHGEDLPDTLRTKATLAVREVGLTLLYIGTKDILREVKALQPMRVFVAVEDASLLSVLSSRSDSLILEAQALACPCA